MKKDHLVGCILEIWAIFGEKVKFFLSDYLIYTLLQLVA